MQVCAWDMPDKLARQTAAIPIEIKVDRESKLDVSMITSNERVDSGATGGE
jgi:hypothetical protein